jgi:6-pyruvoyltetrahydropterin/6-carboxytetrahydropterin synthase
MRLIRGYSFEASHLLHHLPPDHPCSRLHGHGYRFEVTVMGDPDHRGMVIEYAELDEIVDLVLAKYDHRHMNDFLDQPTVENIVVDIFGILEDALPAVARVRLWETERSSVEYP